MSVWGCPHPTEFGALAPAELALTSGGDPDHFRLLGIARFACRDEPIAFPDQEIAHIQRHRDAVFLVQSLFTVALRIVVFDIVMDQ